MDNTPAVGSSSGGGGGESSTPPLLATGSPPNEGQTSSRTALSGATAADSESIGRGSKHSKRSFMGRRRAGSTASSKHLQQRAATSEKIHQPPPMPTTANREGSMRSKKRGGGGLLSCLPCFAPRDSRATGDVSPTENVKRAENVQAGRTSQSTPVKKQEPNPADSITADSKDPIDEKAGTETYGSSVSEKPNHGDGAAERPSHDGPPQIVTRSASKKLQEQSEFPTLPGQPGYLQTDQPEINVTTPTPGTTPVQSRPSLEQQKIIEDQTEEQKQIDADIEMKDVPLSTNDVHQEGEDETAAAQSDHPKIDLPPPPPVEERQDAVHKQVASVAESPEPQKYLLGPIAPRFKGKKCLVLDLDETLVHSSFKVCYNDAMTISPFVLTPR